MGQKLKQSKIICYPKKKINNKIETIREFINHCLVFIISKNLSIYSYWQTLPVTGLNTPHFTNICFRLFLSLAVITLCQRSIRLLKYSRFWANAFIYYYYSIYFWVLCCCYGFLRNAELCRLPKSISDMFQGNPYSSKKTLLRRLGRTGFCFSSSVRDGSEAYIQIKCSKGSVLHFLFNLGRELSTNSDVLFVYFMGGLIYFCFSLDLNSTLLFVYCDCEYMLLKDRKLPFASLSTPLIILSRSALSMGVQILFQSSEFLNRNMLLILNPR